MLCDPSVLRSYDPLINDAGPGKGCCLLGGSTSPVSMVTARANGVQGGYNFRSISKSALAVTKTLMGDPPDRLHSTSPSEMAISTVRRVISTQSAHWHCMYPKVPQNEGLWTDRLHGM